MQDISGRGNFTDHAEFAGESIRRLTIAVADRRTRLAGGPQRLVGEEVGIGTEFLQRGFAGKEENAIGVKHAVLAEAGYGFVFLGGQHDIVAGNHGRVAIEIGQETALLFRPGEEIGPPLMKGSPTLIAANPLLFLHEPDGTAAIESQRRIAATGGMNGAFVRRQRSETAFRGRRKDFASEVRRRYRYSHWRPADNYSGEAKFGVAFGGSCRRHPIGGCVHTIRRTIQGSAIAHKPVRHWPVAALQEPAERSPDSGGMHAGMAAALAADWRLRPAHRQAGKPSTPAFC